MADDDQSREHLVEELRRLRECLEQAKAQHQQDQQALRDSEARLQALREKSPTEEETRASEMRLRLLLRQAPMIIWSTDTELRFTFGQGAGLAPLGAHPEQLRGVSLYAFFQTDDPAYPPIAHHLRALRGEAARYEAEWLGRTYQTHVEPLRNPEGAIVGVIGVALDVTERKQLEERLRQAQKMEALGRVAGGVAHVFNNQMTIVTGYSTLLLEDLPADDPSRELLEAIREAGEEAASVTGLLLAFGRRQVLSPQVINLNALVERLTSTICSMVPEDIKLVTALAPELELVRVDPRQMEEVVLRLVFNAERAMPRGGTLTLQTGNVNVGAEDVGTDPEFQPGRYVLLAVRDTGVGMDQAARGRLFEPFFTTREVGEGSGLNLAASYGVVKQSGGHITVESAPGLGSTFRVYLPRWEAARQPREAGPGPSAISLTGRTVLVAEDDEGVRGLLSYTLRANGYTVLEAADGQEALRVCADHEGPIHLIVTDVVMPNVSGGDLAGRLADLRPEARVLYLSGHSEDAVLRRHVSAGQADFLPKPFTPAALVHKVREMLDEQ